MLNYREERIAMMRFFVEVHRIQREKTGLGDLTAMAVGWIVALGHLEGRPFNASKISSYLSIPRTTVSRKLRWLIQAGFVEQRGHEYYLAPKAETLPDAEYAKIAAAIHYLSNQVKLPKMDSVQNGHKELERSDADGLIPRLT